jgi:hypothetical protein
MSFVKVCHAQGTLVGEKTGKKCHQIHGGLFRFATVDFFDIEHIFIGGVNAAGGISSGCERL